MITRRTPSTSTDEAYSGNSTHSGADSFKNLNNVRFASQYAGTDIGAQINAASADVGANGKVVVDFYGGTISTALSLANFTEIQFYPGNFTFTGAAASNTISNSGIKIKGAGSTATAFFVDSATADFLTIAGTHTEISGLRVLPKSGVTRTAGSFLKVSSSAGSIGLVRDVELRDMFRGFTFDGGGVDSWTLEYIQSYTDGGNWDYFAKTHGNSVGPVTASGFVFKSIYGNWTAATKTTAFFVFDSFTDTVNIIDTNVIVGGTIPFILCQDTDAGGSGQWPRWIHCSNTFAESAGTTLINLVNSRDFTYENSYASGCQVGIALGSGAYNTKILGCVFPNITRQAITIAASNQNTVIIGNTFETTGTDANNTYPVIDVAAGASFFTIVGNTTRSFSANLPSSFVNIASGGSAGFSIGNNILNNLAGVGINNGSIGTNWFSMHNTGANDALSANQVTVGSGAGNDYSVVLTGIPSTFAYKFAMGNRDVRFDTNGTGVVRFTNGTSTNKAVITPGSGLFEVSRLKADKGTALAAGNFALSAGWGSTAAVSGAIGTDQAWTITVTANGTGIAANPTITLTFADGTWTNSPITVTKMTGGTGAFTNLSEAPTTTTNVITFNGTPVAGSTYTISSVAIGR